MTLEQIPISFEHNGKKFKGHFSKVAGAGPTTVFHLMGDNGYYNGRLMLISNKWVFDATPKTKELDELTEYFGGGCYCLVRVKSINKGQPIGQRCKIKNA